MNYAEADAIVARVMAGETIRTECPCCGAEVILSRAPKEAPAPVMVTHEVDADCPHARSYGMTPHAGVS